MLPRKELVPRSSVVCFVSTTVSVKYVCQIALDLHAFFQRLTLTFQIKESVILQTVKFMHLFV